MQGKPDSIDAYLARVPEDRRVALEQLRRTIRAIVPSAEECISYSMPAFRHEGHVVAGFLATTKGCSYYPFSGSTLATLAADVAAYGQTKSALHFDPSKPLPKGLVKKLIAARLAEEAARAPAKKERTGKRRAGKTNPTGSRARAAKPPGVTKRASAGKRAPSSQRAGGHPAKKRARG
jgi:uncharacterized protein YdhG (YjbR/CyaY superfamily)